MKFKLTKLRQFFLAQLAPDRPWPLWPKCPRSVGQFWTSVASRLPRLVLTTRPSALKKYYFVDPFAQIVYQKTKICCPPNKYVFDPQAIFHFTQKQKLGTQTKSFRPLTFFAPTDQFLTPQPKQIWPLRPNSLTPRPKSVPQYPGHYHLKGWFTWHSNQALSALTN